MLSPPEHQRKLYKADRFVSLTPEYDVDRDVAACTAGLHQTWMIYIAVTDFREHL